MQANEITVAVGMSGGVDSSVAAALLVEQGYQVIGIMLRLWSEDGAEADNKCCTPDAMAVARRVAARLKIPFYVIDSKVEFRAIVVEHFLNGYSQGNTPNPCLVCNQQIRWGTMLREAQNLGADYLATGHYARIIQTERGSVRLFKGIDPTKDQSYVLSRLNQTQLQKTILPLGDLTKTAVREIASRFKFASANRPDSQDLCFLGNQPLQPFIARYRPGTALPGKICDINGTVLGEHEGLAFYTIGQRKGIRIAGAEPLYVLRKDFTNNVLIVGTQSQLGNIRFNANQVVWTTGEVPDHSFQSMVKIRYRAPLVPGSVEILSNDEFQVKLQAPARDITPGQAAVLYNDDEVIGSGIIQTVDIEGE